MSLVWVRQILGAWMEWRPIQKYYLLFFNLPCMRSHTLIYSAVLSWSLKQILVFSTLFLLEYLRVTEYLCSSFSWCFCSCCPKCNTRKVPRIKYAIEFPEKERNLKRCGDRIPSNDVCDRHRHPPTAKHWGWVTWPSCHKYASSKIVEEKPLKYIKERWSEL